MTPEVQRMMFEEVKSLAPKAVGEGLIQTALQSSQGGKFFWVVGSASLLGGLLWKGGEYLRLSTLVREVKDLNTSLKASEQDLVLMHRQRQEEFQQMERGVSVLRDLIRQVDQGRKQLANLKEISQAEKGKVGKIRDVSEGLIGLAQAIIRGQSAQIERYESRLKALEKKVEELRTKAKL